MIIDTTSGDSLRQSVSESLNISISEIEKVLRAVDKASRKERYFDCDSVVITTDFSQMLC